MRHIALSLTHFLSSHVPSHPTDTTNAANGDTSPSTPNQIVDNDTSTHPCSSRETKVNLVMFDADNMADTGASESEDEFGTPKLESLAELLKSPYANRGDKYNDDHPSDSDSDSFRDEEGRSTPPLMSLGELLQSPLCTGPNSDTNANDMTESDADSCEMDGHPGYTHLNNSMAADYESMDLVDNTSVDMDISSDMSVVDSPPPSPETTKTLDLHPTTTGSTESRDASPSAVIIDGTLASPIDAEGNNPDPTVDTSPCNSPSPCEPMDAESLRRKREERGENTLQTVTEDAQNQAVCARLTPCAAQATPASSFPPTG